MKHIKTYKIFETWVDVPNTWPDVNRHIQMIEDILLELNDIDYYTSVTPTPLKLAKGEEPDIYVTILDNKKIPRAYSTDKEEFELTENRIIDYMKSNGWKHEVVEISKHHDPLHIGIRFERI